MKLSTVTAPSLTLMISREEIERRNMSSALAPLTILLQSSASVRKACEQVEIEFEGYEEDSREVFEIEDVRAFVRRLDEKFPFWLYFLDKRTTGLQAITMCFMPTNLPARDRREAYPTQLNRLLSKRWFPALNHVCAYAGFDEAGVDAITSRAMQYLAVGPSPILH